MPDVGQMIADNEIYQSASVLIRKNGDGAGFHAAMRADAMLEAAILMVWQCGSGLFGRLMNCYRRSRTGIRRRQW